MAVVVTALALLLRASWPRATLAVPLVGSVAVAGTALAAATGRWRGGVVTAVACVWLPVTAADLAATAVRDPLTVALVARVLPAVAWTALLPSIVLAATAFAVGGWRRVDAPVGEHLRVATDPKSVGVAAGGPALAATAAMAWAVAVGRPTAFPPVPVLVGAVTAVALGVLTRGGVGPTLAGWACATVGVRSFVAGFAPDGGASLRAFAVWIGFGAAIGIPLGVIGYAVGRVLAADRDCGGDGLKTTGGDSSGDGGSNEDDDSNGVGVSGSESECASGNDGSGNDGDDCGDPAREAHGSFSQSH